MYIQIESLVAQELGLPYFFLRLTSVQTKTIDQPMNQTKFDETYFYIYGHE